MSFVKVKNGRPVAVVEDGDLRRLMAKMDPPRLAGRDIAEPPEGYFPLEPAPRPAINPLEQSVEAGEPEFVDGAWRQTWVIAPLPALESGSRKTAFRDELRKRAYARLDEFAREAGFADAGDCISWAGSSLAGQRAKATAMIALRDQTRQAITQIIADIKDGRRATPASFADIAGELPALVWP